MDGDSGNHHLKESTSRYIYSLLIAAVIPIVLYILYRLRSDYLGWYNLGAGGLPHNVIGWSFQSFLRLFAKDCLNTSVYSKPSEIAKGGAVGHRSWLADLPSRTGPRPKVAKWVAPQRQTTDFAPPLICKMLEKEVAGVIAANPGALCSKRSALEGTANAMFIADEIPTPHTIAKKMGREIAHVHYEAEHSMHVCVSPADSVIVVERGWGERQALGGLVVAEEYLILYAPRTEEELKLVGRIVRASAAFMTGGKEIL